jgi:hypothetical protein
MVDMMYAPGRDDCLDAAMEVLSKCKDVEAARRRIADHPV